jgi:hypothetical protein
MIRAWTHCISVVLSVAVLCAGAGLADAAESKKTTNSNNKGVAYKWVDEHGVTHYGDSVPAQYAKKESSVLNKQGVEIGRNDAQKSPEQVAEEARQQELIVRQKQHDAFLLTTYTSVKDIEALRDERLAQLSGQRRAAEAYIDGLNSRLGALQARVMSFKPYNESASARRLPDDLAEDLIRALNEMRTQRMALVSKGEEETTLRAQFQSDIDRFQELRKNNKASR